MSARIRRYGLMAAAGLLAGAVLSGPASAAPVAGPAAAPAPCGTETVTLSTFHVEVHVPKKAYRVGQSALFHVTVTRPAEEDPAGFGVPVPRPTSSPVEDATVSVGLMVEDVYLWGLGKTDEQGHATVPVKIARYTPAGMAQARVVAEKVLANTPCVTFVEKGSLPISDAFQVER